MNRRDFLLLRKMPGEIVAELDGRALYMQSLDAELTDRVDEEGVAHPIDRAPDPMAQTIEGLRDRLVDANTVFVVDREWLNDGRLAQAVERILAEVKARGGRIERRSRV